MYDCDPADYPYIVVTQKQGVKDIFYFKTSEEACAFEPTEGYVFERAMILGY
jgi:hypothetical protein